MPTKQKNRNGKETLRDYMVTVTVEHYIESRAHSPEEAGVKVARAMMDRWGPGRTTVTEVELVP